MGERKHLFPRKDMRIDDAKQNGANCRWLARTIVSFDSIDYQKIIALLHLSAGRNTPFSTIILFE